MTETAAGPVRPAERIQVLDVIRGFALLGILQVNFLYFSSTTAVGNFQSFVLDGKMRTIYSFLFGLGFAVQLMRAEEKGRPFVVRYLWRTLLLLAIGSAHFVFIWKGDILRDYAIMAVLLLVVRRCRPWILLTLAAVIMAFSVWGSRNWMGTSTEPLLWRADPEHLNDIRRASQARNDMLSANRAQREHAEQDGGYLAGVKAGAVLLIDQLRRTDINTFIRNDLMTMFLLGLYVGRRRILHEPEKHRKLLWRVLGVGLAAGATLAFYSVFGEFAKSHHFPNLPDWADDSFTYSVGNCCCALFYISAVTLLFLNCQRWRGWVPALAAVGRMGLTNYLMHSVIMTTLLYARGLGLEQHAYVWWGILMLESVYVLQIFYSRWWLKRFQFGPVEWAWRSATWLRWQPMRIPVSPEPEAPAAAPVPA